MVINLRNDENTFQASRIFSTFASDEINLTELNSEENKCMDSLLEQLVPLKSVTRGLQETYISLSDVHILFDAIVEQYLDTPNGSSTNADIARCLSFWSCIVKIQKKGCEGNA